MLAYEFGSQIAEGLEAFSEPPASSGWSPLGKDPAWGATR